MELELTLHCIRDDYVYHVEFNDIHEYGEGILSDFGGIYMGKSRTLLLRS